MCGLAGVFRMEGPSSTADLETVRAMMAAEVHRGPDDEGTFQDDSVALGHRRLAILDLSPAGRQPMSTPDAKLWVVHNGEVYNFAELRAELAARGYVFRSKSDTEVLLHGYVAWGLEVLLGRLRGMFAFAIYDRRRHDAPLLLMARDRFGIKPLYYYRDRDRLVFASETRAFRVGDVARTEKNPEALARFLQWGSIATPNTTLKGVLSVPPGHFVSVGRGGTKVARYFRLRTEADEAKAASDTRALLEDAVRLHLVSDVPLGIFLSGGIDSSALVALSRRFRSEPLTTLSVVFDEPRWNEADFARRVAREFATDHREVRVRSSDFFESLPRVLDAMDQPTVDGVNTYFVSKAAKECGLTVVLSGAGSDEIFLGYPHFRRARTLASFPAWARRGMAQVARVSPGGPWSRARKLEHVDDTYRLFRGLFTRRQVRALLGGSDLDPALGDVIDPDANACPVSNFSRLEIEHYLRDQLLKDADFMSMAHSIETRVPFLDHPLVEHVLGLSVETRMRPGVPKALLLEALGGQIPREVWDRPKMGFTFPFEEWVRKQPEELRSRSLESGLFERKAVESLWESFLAGHTHWSRVWALAVASQFRL